LTRILIDENIPRDVKEWLTKKGFDTISISQTHLKSAKDYAVAEYAAKK
jgi:predicted nuclease of predicted toxin-antitoxin system